MADRFSEGVSKLQQQTAQPAAPAGLQQQAKQSQADRFAQGQTALQQWRPADYVEKAQSWYTGANQNGQASGWDTGFVESFTSGWGQALEQGTARNYFSDPNATGVVLWDHQSDDGSKNFAFGDVYENGKYQGNLYDQFDRDTANLMVAPWMLDNDVQAKAFSADDRMERLNREIVTEREHRAVNFEKALGASEFAGDVKRRAEGFQEGVVDEAIAGGGLAGGAALGAGVGAAATAWTGPGAAIGAGVGALVGGAVGGIGAWLNRDSLTEQAARAYEITKISYNDHGLAGGVATGVHQWSGFGGKLISPLSNVTQGAFDAAAGKGGDGQSEFYRVDDSGKSKTPTWVKTADVAATLGDALLQFATPAGVAMYTAQMGGVVGGQVVELAATGGETFDYRRGGFDNIFTDEKGNLDASAAAAGIGKVGIDAVQLGMARGLVGKTNAALGQVGEQAVYKTLGAKVGEKLPLWMGGSRGLAQGEERVRAAGMSFTRAADGTLRDGRATLGLLAPSEQIAALSARVLGQRSAAKAGGAYTADDFYAAANALAVGPTNTTMRNALVNGFGEGYEEAVQAMLEPHSHGGSIDATEVITSALYGAAAGAGMTAGAQFRAPTADEQMFHQAQVGRMMATGGDVLSRDEWNAMPALEKRKAVAGSGLAKETAAAAYRKIAEDQAAEHTAGVAGINKLHDAIQATKDTALARATDRTDGAFVITQLEELPALDADGNLLPGSIPVNAVAGSALQTGRNLTNHLRGVDIARRTLADRHAKLIETLDPADQDAVDAAAALERQLRATELTLEWGAKFDQVFDQYVARLHDPAATPASIEADAAELNDVLRRAFNSELDVYDGQPLTPEDKLALARAVSMVFVRDPQDQAGSYQVLVPQVSARLTATGTDNLLEISHAILPAIRGDYDGDKIRQQAQLIFDDTEFASARAGAHFLGAGSSVNVGAPKYEKYVVAYLAESLASTNLTLRGYAEQTLQSIGAAVRKRYDTVVDPLTLDEVLDSFFTAVRANDKDARAKLLDGLAEFAGGEITDFARANLSNEWLWLDQLIGSTLQRFQESYAAHRPDLGAVPNTNTVAPNQQSTDVRTRRAEAAATLGQTLGLFSAGDSMFRKFQKLHYTVIGSPVLSAEGLEPTSLTEMAELYRELGQQVTRSELERVRAADDISARVFVQLERLAADAQKLHPSLNKFQALTVVANIRVADIDVDEAGDVSWAGNQVSLAQMLLKRAIVADQREKAAILDASPELQAKHARLLKMTRPNSRDYPHGAEQAFVEAVGAQQMFTLLGDEAGTFGPHLTVEQFIREYTSLSEYDRRDVTRKLQSDPAYLGRRQSKNMPYDLDEVAGGDISAFRAVVDAVLAVGNSRISIDNGVLHGEIAERSDLVGENFRAAHFAARSALQEFAGLSPREDGELTVEMVQRLLEGNPDFARQVMNLIPNASAAAAFQVRGGQVYAANWLYSLFTISDPQAAEMHYWRNLLLAEWNALGLNTAEEGEHGEKGREYNRLPRRMHRILYKLAAENDGGLLLTNFVQTMEKATDLTEFIRWVNTTPGIRGEQAPLTAWVDDVAEFDADKTQGGWTTVLPGAELREAISMLRARSENLVGELVAERTALANDVRTMAAIRRVIRKDAGSEVTLDAGDREIYNAFVKRLEMAGDWHVSMGPQAMLHQTLGAVRGFYSQAHTKGKNPPNVQPAGALDAARDAFDYVTNYERLLASMTAVNLDAVGGNLAQVAKDGGRSMDDHGRTVEWDRPTPEQMLDLLENPDSRPYARAVLFPQVMERTMDGRLSPQFLVGKSLSELLRGNSHKELFPRNGRLSQEAAFKYVSMVEGVAREFGGHFAVQRAVNDLVIARTSMASHELTEFELESMTTRAYHEVAQVLQAVGSIAATPADPGTDPMAEILAEVRKTQRRIRTGRALGMDVADVELMTDVVLDTFIDEREKELLADIDALLDAAAADPTNQHRYQDQIEAAQNDFDRFKVRIELLRTDDVAGQVVEMFAIEGSPTEQAAKKQAVLEYILAHPAILESASASKITLSKLTQQMLDSARNGQPDLTDNEWAELSRAVIGFYLDDVASTTASGVSVSPWPDADRENDQRYFDTSWSYLVEELLRADGPLAQAAKKVHLASGRAGAAPTTQAEFFDLLGRTVLDGKRLGPWTSDIPRASIEANQRLDSSAAEPAIAMAGNAPKRQATIMAATRRTTLEPDESLLSTTALSWIDLNREVFDEVEVTLPTGPGRRPLAQLNNRFARSVTMQVTDSTGQTVDVDLLAESAQLGRKFHGHAAVANSGYSEIHLDRVRRAVDIVSRKYGADPQRATVTIEFFHPDSQPEGPEWFHNVYFEGTSFKLDADRHESLISTLWFAHESISPANQAAALDASKLGLPALQVIETVDSGNRQVLESDWDTDLAAVLRAKARVLLDTDLGFGALDVEFFNAVYKDLKLRHFVRGTTPEGAPVLLAAEQVIALQQAGQPLPIEGAELWVPTDDVLRSMLGEQGTQGVARIFDDQLEVDPSAVPAYRGVTNKMLSRFEGITAGDRAALPETRVANRARQIQLTVRTMLDEKLRNAFDERMRFFRERAAEIHTDRGEAQRTDGLGFNAKNNLHLAVTAGGKMLEAENLSLHWAAMGIPFGPRKPEETVLSKMLLRDLASATESDGFRTGWIYREGSAAQPLAGLLSEVSLGATDRAAYRVAPGDLVVVELDSFAGDADLARKRIDYLSSNGALVLLGATDGQADLRAELSEYLISDRQYEPIAGSQHAYQPGEFGSRFQNQRARASTLTETRGVSTKNRVATFLTTGLPVHENAAWAYRNDNERLGAIAVTSNLVPTAALAGFNVPTEGFANESQIEKVRAHLRGLDNAEGRAFLQAQTEGDPDFDRAFDRLLERFDANPGTVLPQPGDQFGKGDIIPLVDQVGRVLLYRHGYKALDRWQVDERMARTLPSSYDAANVAVFPSVLEPAATIHTGEVVRFRQRAGYGLSVELNVPLSVFGDKKQLEWNGMKYVIAPMPDSIVLPDHGFFPEWDIDLVSDADSAFSKESFDGLVDSHRAAFAYFGIDFLPDVTEFFFPGQRDSMDARTKTREMLHAIATRAPRMSVAAAHELINSDRLGASFSDILPDSLVSMVDRSWLDRLSDQSPIENRIASAMVLYLMTPGARVEDVLASGGFNADGATSSEMQSRLMPRLFTQVFDSAPLGSALRTEINNRLNDQLHNPHNDGTGYILHQDWTFDIRNSDPAKNMRGFLQFAEAHSSGDNPVKNGMSFDDSDRQQVSQHSAAIAFGATGAETAYAYDIAKARAFAEGAGITRFERDKLDGGAWRMLTAIPKKDSSFHAWKAATPAEAARRENAREAMVQFRQPIDQTIDDLWTDKQRKEYADLAHQIVRELHLLDAQSGVVDFWVRQLLGMPHGTDTDGRDLGRVHGKGAIEAAQDILWNVQNRYLPVVGAEVPQLHLHDLQAIYRANKHQSNPWLPRESVDGASRPVKSWDDWVMVSLGSALTSDNLFDPLYLLALDGFVHGYQNATRSLMDLPVSVDALVAQNLLDPDLNQMVVSINEDVDLLATNPTIVDAVRADVNMLIGGQRIAGKFHGRAAPASEVAKRRAKRRAWRKENGVPVPLDVTMKNFRKNGIEAVNAGSTTNALYRGLINLRVGTALINPALYVSMGPEQWIRGTLDRAANILTGQSTAGVTGEMLARAGLSRYTPEQLANLRRLYDVLGDRSDFKGMVYSDLFELRPHEMGQGRISRGLEGYAKFGSRLQDPTYGMRATTLARRYVEAALQHIEATPTLNTLTVDTLVANLRTNPEFLKNNYPEAHVAATNSIAQLRSLKATPLSLALRGVYEPMSESPNLVTSFIGNVVLKIPMLFSGYAMNVLTTITGLQGLSDATAMFLDGRAKGPNSLIGRMQAKLRGKEFSVEDDANFDMTSVIEGIDLSRSFLRGALTHTALFSFGLAAGGLGLSGEDEEMKRQRRLAELQGVTALYDPRAVENDFRNADALFFDFLPPQLRMGKMHWMLKQFLSPVMGMEKFFETGDFRQVTWGFEDALGAFPLINAMMWSDAVETVGALTEQADVAEANGDTVGAATFLTTAVGTYERMLFENSFVNQLYIGFDDYDRDPYVLPLRDSDGELQRDIEGNARPNDLALQSFLDPETEQIRQGWLGRSEGDAARHVLTENRASMAIIASLFTGGIGDSDYWRYNMPIKTRTIEKADVDKDTVEAYVKAAAVGGGLGKDPMVDVEEILPQVRNMLYAQGDASGHFYTDAEVRAVAEKMAARMGSLDLSLMDESGREKLTTKGARAVFDGLKAGTVTLGHESLAGIHISFEMRNEIQQEWTKELVQEGIDLGLDETKAIARMKRVMYGPLDNPSVQGLADLLWSKDISYQDTQTYAQLNTTYVIGPDGRPWATGFSRDKLMGALGLKPFATQIMPEGSGTKLDSRYNVIDLVNGNNTGLRALVPLDDTRNVPTDVEIGKSIEDAIKAAAGEQYTPFKPFESDGGSGYTPWKKYGGYGGYKRKPWKNYGGGGGGGAYFSKMYGMPDNEAPYGNNVSFINTSNPILRRANVRRERVWSERGRLKQWQ